MIKLAIPYSMRQEFWAWCTANNVGLEYAGSVSNPSYAVDWWLIGQTHHCWVLLKWGAYVVSGE